MDINFRAIEAYITKRREEEKSNATINREPELLRRAMRLGHDRQLLPSVPKVRVLPENNTRQGFFERPDLEAVVAALPDYLRDFTRFAYLTGWRKGEIISLKWTDVHWQGLGHGPHQGWRARPALPRPPPHRREEHDPRRGPAAHRRGGDRPRHLRDVRPLQLVDEQDLRMAAQRTTMYVDTLPTKRPVESSARMTS